MTEQLMKTCLHGRKYRLFILIINKTYMGKMLNLIVKLDDLHTGQLVYKPRGYIKDNNQGLL